MTKIREVVICIESADTPSLVTINGDGTTVCLRNCPLKGLHVIDRSSFQACSADVISLEPKTSGLPISSSSRAFSHPSYQPLFETSCFKFFSFVLRPQECSGLHCLPFNGLLFFLSHRSMKSLDAKSSAGMKAPIFERDRSKEALVERILGHSHGLFSDQMTEEEIEKIRQRLGCNELDDKVDDLQEQILHSLKEGDEDKTLDLRLQLTEAMMERDSLAEQSRTPEGPRQLSKNSPFIDDATARTDGGDVIFFQGPVSHNLVNIGSDVVRALLVQIK